VSTHVQHPTSSAQQVKDLGVLTLHSERDGDTHVLTLSGELDLVTAPEVEKELRIVEAGDADVIVVDLSALEFVDSTGLRLLIQTEQRSRWEPGRIALRRPPERVMRIFTIAGIDALLPFVD
jgi:anti-sigma B factor antagonist